MATVIDSLLIELGLDASKFDSAQKKSVQQLRKFDDQSNKTFKNTQRNVNDLGKGFSKAQDALISLGATLLSVKGFSSLVDNVTTTNANLGRTSRLLNMTASDLSVWGGVMKSVGGEANDFQSSVQSMQEQLAKIPFGGSTEILKYAALLGAQDAVNLQNGTVDILKLADAIKKYKDQFGEQAAFVQAQGMGINLKLFQVLEQGSGAVNQLYEASKKNNGVTQENTASAEKLQQKWGDVSNAWGRAANQVTDQLSPAMYGLAQFTEKALETFVEWDKSADGLVTKIGSLSGAILTLKMGLKALGISMPAWLLKLVGGAGLAAYSSDLNKGEDEALAAEKEKAAKEGRMKPDTRDYGIKPTSVSDKSKELMDHIMAQGVDKSHAAALVGNFMQESSLNPQARNVDKKGESHLGLGQWGPERQADFKAFSGFELTDPKATAKVQADFALHELKQGKYKKVGQEFFGSQDLAQQTDILNKKYEIAGDTSGGKRLGYAQEQMNALNASMGKEWTPSDTAADLNAMRAAEKKPAEKPALEKTVMDLGTPKPWAPSNTANDLDAMRAMENKPAANSDLEKTLMGLSAGNLKPWSPSDSTEDLNNMMRSSTANVPIGATATTPTSSNSGSKSVETNIQNINIQTQATDSKGIAQDIGTSITNNQMINQGLAGNI